MLIVLAGMALVTCLGLLVVVLGGFVDADSVPLGRTAGAVLLTAGVVASVAGGVTAARPTTGSSALVMALLVGAVAGGLLTMTIAAFITSDATTAAFGIPLAMAAITMTLVAYAAARSAGRRAPEGPA